MNLYFNCDKCKETKLFKELAKAGELMLCKGCYAEEKKKHSKKKALHLTSEYSLDSSG
jgi:hypothetical protein